MWSDEARAAALAAALSKKSRAASKIDQVRSGKKPFRFTP